MLEAASTFTTTSWTEWPLSSGHLMTFKHISLIIDIINRRSSDEMEDQERPHRAKRSLNSDYYSQFEIQGEYDDVGIEDLTTPAYQDADLPQSLLSSSLNGHKIRNIKNKIRKLGPDSQVYSLSTFANH